MNSPPILDINQVEATSMKCGYKTTSLPLDFWKSLFINYPESIVEIKGKVCQSLLDFI